MKKCLLILPLSLAATALYAQGLVNFANTPNTLVSVEPLVYPPQPYTIMSGPPGSYYFGLFLGAPNPGSYTFTGIYATNAGVNGLFSGGVVAVPGWAPGTSHLYFVAGWDAASGHDFQPVWLTGLGVSSFGVSLVGTGTAGDGASISTLNLFDGGSTIQGGLQLGNNLVPEPSTVALAIVGATVLMVCRRKQA
jgi:hypothetical protein